MDSDTYSDKDLACNDFSPGVKFGIKRAAVKLAKKIDQMIFDEMCKQFKIPMVQQEVENGG